MRVTLSDIASRVGTSKMTVSLALRGSDRIGKVTSQRILALARELGYRPNVAAQAISRGRFDCIALLLSTRGFGRSTLPMQLLAGIDQALSDHDLHLTLTRLPDEKLTSEGVVPKILRRLMADGLLVNYTDMIPQRMIELIETHNLPAVWLNTKRAHDCVHPDDFGGGRMLVQYLLQKGHRRIAYFDQSHPVSTIEHAHYSAVDRLEGCRQAMREAGLLLRVSRSEQSVPRGQRLEIARQLLAGADRPTAVIAYGNITPVIVAALSMGLRMPDDLEPATFADTSTNFGGVDVTTAVVPQGDMGVKGTQMLLAKIAEPATRLPRHAVPFAEIRCESPTVATGTTRSWSNAEDDAH